MLDALQEVAFRGADSAFSGDDFGESVAEHCREGISVYLEIDIHQSVYELGVFSRYIGEHLGGEYLPFAAGEIVQLPEKPAMINPFLINAGAAFAVDTAEMLMVNASAARMNLFIFVVISIWKYNEVVRCVMRQKCKKMKE